MGGKKAVKTVQWSVGGDKLASGGVEHDVRVHDVEHGAGTGRGAQTLRGHAGAVEQLRFDPSRQGGDRALTVSSDKTAKIWDAKSGKCAGTIEMKEGLMNAAWSPSGRHVAVGSKSDVISIVDVTTMKVIWEQKFKYEANEMMWDKTGKSFMMATGEGKMEKFTFDETTGSLTPLSSHFAHNGGCYCMAIDPTGKYHAMGAADAIVSLWESETNICYDTIVRLDYPIRSVSYSHDSRYIAAASEDLKIDVAEVMTGDCVAQIKTKEAMNTIAFHPKELVLAYAGDGGDISLWSAFTAISAGTK